MEFASWNHVGTHGLNFLELACAADTGVTIIPSHILDFLRDVSFEDILYQAAERQVGAAKDPGGQLKILSTINWNRLVEGRWPRTGKWARCGWTMGFWTDHEGVITPLAMVRSEFHPSNSGDCESHPEPCAWFEIVPNTTAGNVAYTSCDMIIGDEKTGRQMHLQTHNAKDGNDCGPAPREGCTKCINSQGHFFRATGSSRYQKSTQEWIDSRSRKVRDRLLAVAKDKNPEGKLRSVARFQAAATTGTFSRIGRILDPGKSSFRLEGMVDFDAGLNEVRSLIQQANRGKPHRNPLSWVHGPRNLDGVKDSEKAQPDIEELA